MTERKRTPEEILEELINKNIKFQVAEICFLILGAAGTGAILIGKNMTAALATGPLSFSIFLNLINRRKLDQLTRQQTFLDTTEVQRRLAAEIQGMRGQVSEGGAAFSLPAGEASHFQSTLDQMSESLRALETQVQMGGASVGDTNGIAEELEQLRNHQLDLAQSLEAVNQQLRAMPSEGSAGSYEQELAEIRQSFAAIQQQPVTSAVDVDSLRNEFQGMIGSLQQQMGAIEERATFAANSEAAGVDMSALQSELQQMMLPVQQQVAAMEERVAATSASSTDMSEFQQMLMPLQQQVAGLESHLQSQAGAPQSDSLRAELHQLVAPIESKLNALEGRFQEQTGATANSQVEDLRAELQNMISPLHQQVSGIEARVMETATATPQVQAEELQQVQGQMSALSEKFEHVAAQLSAEIAGFQQQLQTVSAPAAGIDTSIVEQQLQASISPLQEKLASLDQRLHNLPVPDPQVSQVQSEQMISLQNQVNSLNGYLEEISTELAKVPQMVEEKVHSKVATLQPVAAAPAADPKKDALSELDSILADINF
jgi:predicted  nucleic acid-binding Zn-ribbon protein